MEEKTITITLAEYKKLIEESVRIKIFSEFVRTTKYSIERVDCGAMLGFNVDEKED